MAPDTTRAAGIAAQVWPNANPMSLETQMALAETERALLAQQAIARQQQAAKLVPAVQREAGVSHNTYNMPGSREAWERYGAPPVMVQSDPYARVAYRQNPDGSFTAFQGFASVYPHVVRGVNDPSAPEGLARWHYLIDQARQANPYSGRAARAINAPRRTSGGGGGGTQKPQSQAPANDQPAAEQRKRGLKNSGPDERYLQEPLVNLSFPAAERNLRQADDAVSDGIVSANIGVWGASGRDVRNLMDRYKDVPLPSAAPPNIQLLSVDEIEADPDFTGYIHEPGSALATQMQQADVQQQAAAAMPSWVSSALQVGLPVIGAGIGTLGGPIGSGIGGIAGTKLAGLITGEDPSLLQYGLSALPAAGALLRGGAKVLGGYVVPQAAVASGKGAAPVSGGVPKPVLPTGGRASALPNSGAAPVSGATRPVLPSGPVAPVLPSGPVAPVLPSGPVAPVLPFTPTFQLSPTVRAALAGRQNLPQLPASPLPMGTAATPYPVVPVPPNMPTGPAIQIPRPVFAGVPGFAQPYVLPSAIR